MDASRGLDADEEQLKLLTFAGARDAAEERLLVVEAMLADLDRISADAESTNGDRFDDDWLSEAGAKDDHAATDLLMRQACYRAASAAVASPVAASLAAFLD